MREGFAWAPEMEPPTAEDPTAEPPPFEPGQPSARTLTYEVLAALLQEQDSAAFEHTMEVGPSASSEFLLDLAHSQAVEAGQGEHPFALPTREDVERSSYDGPLLSNTDSSTELMQGTGVGRIWAGDFDFGHSLDGREGWAEIGCPDKL
jgi:hypothetical protein